MLRAAKENLFVVFSRILIAGICVFVTYNPWGKSIYHWATSGADWKQAKVILVLGLVAGVHLLLLIATWRTLRKLGTLIFVFLFGVTGYMFFQEGWLTSTSGTGAQSLYLALYSVFTGIGLFGSKLWKKLTGQVVIVEGGDDDSSGSNDDDDN